AIGIRASGQRNQCIRWKTEMGEVIASNVRFAERIAEAYATGDEDDWGKSALIQRGCVIEPGSEDGGGPAVILCRAKDHDRVGAGGFVARAVDRNRDDDCSPGECEQYYDKKKAA